MIDVHKTINSNKTTIELNDGEDDALLVALKFYLHDMDANAKDGHYETVKEIYDKIIAEK